MNSNHVDLPDPVTIHLQAFDDDSDPKTNYYFRLGEEGWTTSGCFRDNLCDPTNDMKGCKDDSDCSSP